MPLPLRPTKPDPWLSASTRSQSLKASLDVASISSPRPKLCFRDKGEKSSFVQGKFTLARASKPTLPASSYSGPGVPYTLMWLLFLGSPESMREPAASRRSDGKLAPLALRED